MRRILVVTGNRAEYDILYSVMKAIEKHSDLELNVLVAGTHLSEKYGYTVQEIEYDKFPIVDRVYNLIASDALIGRAETAALGALHFTQSFARIRPDMVVVLGDREDTIAAALACIYLNIPLAHIGGGDRVWGNVDDVVRHAVTKLAHLHFPTNQESAIRIKKLGEEEWRIHCFGHPALDRLVSVPKFSKEELSKRLDFDMTTGPVLLLVQHPLSSEVELAGQHMEITLEALKELGVKVLIGYPNSDAGNEQIVKVINRYVSSMPFVKTYHNLSRLEFVNLLRNVDVLVGNSSLGILEAPLLKLPVVNIGKRQTKRLHAENVIFVPNAKAKIIAAIKKALHDNTFKTMVKNCHNPYGDGHSSELIAEVLAKISIDNKLRVKDITY